MTGLAPISVIVVSWQRPECLKRCLSALRQQDHPEIELVLVLDPAALAWFHGIDPAQRPRAKVAENPGGNISAARNVGLAMAQGAVVAFIDDDAVAEPSWARRLAEVFGQPDVVAATGYTRGRSGMAFQWRSSFVDETGLDHDMAELTTTKVFAASGGQVVKTVGTNCAFRRKDLMAIGGFDPAYRFYLEDADAARRISERGSIAVVPLAQVHHGFAASDRRRADRCPTDLTQIGASSRFFLRRHAPGIDPAPAMARLRQEQTARLSRFQRKGQLSGAEAQRLLAGLEEGISQGALRPLTDLAAQGAQANPVPEPAGFLALGGTGPRPGRVIAGRFWQRRRLLAEARQAAAQGVIATVFCFTPSFRAHRIGYDPAGFWVQEGGLFGWSHRKGRRFIFDKFATRLQHEAEVWSKLRPML